jgi:hypothetical protein
MSELVLAEEAGSSLDPWMIVVGGLVLVLLAAVVVRDFVVKRRGEAEVGRWDDNAWATGDWTFLRTLYSEAGGSPAKQVEQSKLAGELKWSRPAFAAVRDRRVPARLSSRLVTVPPNGKRRTEPPR